MPDEVHVEVDGRTLKLSNLDKVLYPQTGTTKGEVLNYYAQVAPVLLPHVADRAVTRIRWPNGTAKPSFFEKNAPAGAPSWLRIAKVPTTGSRGSSRRERRRAPLPGHRRAGVARPTWSTSPRSSSTCTSGRSGRTVARRTPTGW